MDKKHPPFLCITYAHINGGNEKEVLKMEGCKKRRVNIYISEDTAERLKQYAWENRTSVSHAVTEWIWHTRVKNEQVRGQTSLNLK